MALRAALLKHERAQTLAVVIEQLRRAHGASDDDRILREAARGARADAAREQP